MKQLDPGSLLAVNESTSAKDLEFVTQTSWLPKFKTQKILYPSPTSSLRFASVFCDASVCTLVLHRSLLDCNYALNYSVNNDEKYIGKIPIRGTKS